MKDPQEMIIQVILIALSSLGTAQLWEKSFNRSRFLHFINYTCSVRARLLHRATSNCMSISNT